MVLEYMSFSAESFTESMMQCDDTSQDDGYNVVMATVGMNKNRANYTEAGLNILAPTFEGVPINLDHDADRVCSVVGYITQPRIVDNKLVGKAVFSPKTEKYQTVMGFISSRFSAGQIPNVSVGIWAEVEYDEEENVKHIHGGYADHLAIVTNGACDPKMGCGLGLGLNPNISDDCKCTENTSTVDDSDNDESDELLKQILLKKIRQKEE